ncbi:hypothetical protein NE857_25890 [Nocardiopsis exhalans]|uniref:Uncharacterized protein n=1 Tax=Nocardiopsis exhalans TaxID=163604 RepID=A0ABY5D2U8_9ACTN|nr:hypothetical protein [Nocardiopsis exhalans]USY18692.1 hypothetical protein NE857_25890 [Nocardiopsis exhalans]
MPRRHLLQTDQGACDRPTEPGVSPALLSGVVAEVWLLWNRGGELGAPGVLGAVGE